MGIFLPTHTDYGRYKYNKCIIPPRLYDNAGCAFAKLYDWNTNPSTVQKWINEAFIRRKQINPNNSRHPFSQNRYSDGLG